MKNSARKLRLSPDAREHLKANLEAFDATEPEEGRRRAFVMEPDECEFCAEIVDALKAALR